MSLPVSRTIRVLTLIGLALVAILVPSTVLASPAASVVVLCENRTFDGYTTKPFVLKSTIATNPAIQKVIHNCTFRNSTLPAIVLKSAQNVLIENSTFENIRTHKPGVGVFAISLFCSKGCKIDNITIRNNSFKYIGADGIQMGVSGRAISNVRVQGNYFEGNDAVGENGVDIKGVVGPIIVSGNTFKGFRPCESPKRGGQQDCTGSNGPGMVIHTGTSGMPYNVTVTDNDFINNVLGLVVSAGAHNIIVRGNRFTSNADTGLLVAGAYSIQADTNTFTNNPTQLRFQNTPQLGGYCTAIGNIFAGIGEKLVLVNSQCQQ